MRKFILNGLLFLSLFLVCNTIVYLFAQDVYHESYNKVPYKSFDSFIFADSYGMALRDYGEEYNVYNFAMASDSYFDIKRKLSYLIRNDYQINTVYIGVDNHSLSTNREHMNNLDRSVYYSSSKDFSNPLTYFKERYLVYYVAIFRPSVRALFRSYLFQNAKSLLKRGSKVKENSFDWSSLAESQRKKEAEAIIEIQFLSQNRSEELKKVLEEIIALSKEHQFELIGVKFPVSESYLKAMNNANYGADEVFVAHGIPVLNFKRKYLERDELFADSNHLNDKGAEQIIKIILNK